MDDPAVMMIKKNTLTLVAVTGAMTVDRIEELKAGLLEAFDLGKKVQLSLAGVTEIDLAGLQLICSAHRTSLARDLELTVAGGEGEPVASAARLSGMLRHAGCAQDTAGTCVWKRGS